jgi:hypothetical protein
MIIVHMKLYEPISINMYLCWCARVWLQKKKQWSLNKKTMVASTHAHIHTDDRAEASVHVLPLTRRHARSNQQPHHLAMLPFCRQLQSRLAALCIYTYICYLYISGRGGKWGRSLWALCEASWHNCPTPPQHPCLSQLVLHP